MLLGLLGSARRLNKVTLPASTFLAFVTTTAKGFHETLWRR